MCRCKFKPWTKCGNQIYNLRENVCNEPPNRAMSNMQIPLPTHQVCWRVCEKLLRRSNWTCTKCLLEVLPTGLSLNLTIDVSQERNDSIHSASSERHPLCMMSNMRQTHHNNDLNINSIQNKFDELKESNKKLKVILSSRLIII